VHLTRRHQPSIEDRIGTYVLTAERFGDCLLHRGPPIMWVGPRRRDHISRLVFELIGGYPLKSSEQLIQTCCPEGEAGCPCLNVEHMKVV
jgi:hypothetical protein